MEAEVANMQSKVTSKRRREGETDLREKDPTFVDNDYAECYPGLLFFARFSRLVKLEPTKPRSVRSSIMIAKKRISRKWKSIVESAFDVGTSIQRRSGPNTMKLEKLFLGTQACCV